MTRPHASSSRESLFIVCGLVALTQASWGLIIPVLPIYAHEFGANAFQLGLVVAAFSVSRLLVNLPAGLLSDRVNRRILVIVASIGVAATLAITAGAVSLVMLFILRAVLGLFGGVVITVGQALLADMTEVESRGRSMATLQAFQLAGGTLGPALGGVTATLWGPRGAYFIGAGVCLTMAVVALIRLPRRSARVERIAERPKVRPFALFRDPSFDSASLVGFTVFFLRFGGMQTLVPLIAYSWAGISSLTLGIALSSLTVLNLLQVRLVGRISDWSRKVPIVVSLAVTAVGYGVFSVSHNWIVFFVALLIVGVANGFSGSTPAAYVADVVPPTMRGAGVGVYRTFGDLGGLVGPIAIGAVVDLSGMGLAAWMTAAVAFVMALVFLFVAKETVGPRARWKPTQTHLVERVEEAV